MLYPQCNPKTLDPQWPDQTNVVIDDSDLLESTKKSNCDRIRTENVLYSFHKDRYILIELVLRLEPINQISFS